MILLRRPKDKYLPNNRASLNYKSIQLIYYIVLLISSCDSKKYGIKRSIQCIARILSLKRLNERYSQLFYVRVLILHYNMSGV